MQTGAGPPRPKTTLEQGSTFRLVHLEPKLSDSGPVKESMPGCFSRFAECAMQPTLPNLHLKRIGEVLPERSTQIVAFGPFSPNSVL